MASPWVDWLLLRGHLLPFKLAWRSDEPPPLGDLPSGVQARHPFETYQALATLRLCLGIGDGMTRLQ